MAQSGVRELAQVECRVFSGSTRRVTRKWRSWRLFDISECAVCGGRLRITAVLTDLASIQCYLNGISLPAWATNVVN